MRVARPWRVRRAQRLQRSGYSAAQHASAVAWRWRVQVANLPLVPGVPIPKELYQIDQTRIVGLTIDPNVRLAAWGRDWAARGCRNRGHAEGEGCVPRSSSTCDTLPPQVLMSIRRNRVGQMGVRDFGMPIDYAEIQVRNPTLLALRAQQLLRSSSARAGAAGAPSATQRAVGHAVRGCLLRLAIMCALRVQKIHSELAFAQQLYAANEWPVLDVTLRGVEETAARILKLLNDKRGDASPQW